MGQKQPTQEEAQKAAMMQGNNLLTFLNKPGVSPPLTPHSMDEYKAWQVCCNLAMGLMSGELTIVKSDQPGNMMNPAMTAAKKKAVTKAKKKVKK